MDSGQPLKIEAMAFEGLEVLFGDLRFVIAVDWQLDLLARVVDGYSFLAAFCGATGIQIN